jgi:thiol-disulfide isomerase/thioredoxin
VRKPGQYTCAVALLLVLTGSVRAQSEKTPADCVRSVRDFLSQRMKAERGRINAEIYRSIQKEKAERAMQCATAFSVDSVAPSQAMDLAELYAEADQPSKIGPAVSKALSAPGLDDASLARLLAQAVTVTMKLPVSPARDAEAEGYVARIDKLSDEFVREKIQAHARMNSYYRADDIDRGIIEHSRGLLALGRKLNDDGRKALAGPLTAACINLAEAYASQGETAQALETLRRGPSDLAGVPDVGKKLEPSLERYLLVGRLADPIEARTWINGRPGTDRYEPKGVVTFLQFTAHWCGPCRKSYPAVASLQRKYGPRGLKVVMATQLYGYFQGRQNLSSDEEIAADRQYFTDHLGSGVTVAVADPPVAPEGKERPENVNEAHYKVGGIPQVHIIDRKGIHRLIMVGFDPSNEERVGRFIEGLLNEPQ